jgi:hypothetical protein
MFQDIERLKFNTEFTLLLMLKLQMRQFGHDEFQRRHFIIAWKWKANWKTNKKYMTSFFPQNRSQLPYPCSSRKKESGHACDVTEVTVKVPIVNNCPTRYDYVQLIIFFCKRLYMFRMVTSPIIRSTYICNYSVIAEGTTNLIFSGLHTLHFPKFDQCQTL